jgi:hypothetical protein
VSLKGFKARLLVSPLLPDNLWRSAVLVALARVLSGGDDKGGARHRRTPRLLQADPSQGGQ